MTYKNLCFIGLIIWLLVVGVGCNNDKKEVTTSDAELVIRISKEPEKINPILFPAPNAREIYQNIFLSLADFDPVSLSLEPVLIDMLPQAEAYGEGGVSFKIKIKDEAVWDNGQPITGHDYAFTVKAALHPQTGATAYRAYLSNISKIEVDTQNPKVFTVFFDNYYLLAKETVLTMEIYPAYHYDPSQILSKYDLAVLKDEAQFAQAVGKDSTLSKFAADFTSTAFSRTDIEGAGPYNITTWETNQYILLERKENYWAAGSAVPNLKSIPKRIIYKIIPDEASALVDLRNGEIDMMSGLSPASFKALKEDTLAQRLFSFETPQLTRYYHFLFNTQHPYLKDPKVRLGLSQLLDVDQLIKDFENGAGVRLTSPVVPSKPFYNQSLKPIAFDLTAAKANFEAAGWKDTDGDGLLDRMIDGVKKNFELELYVAGAELGRNISLILAENAKKVGLNIQVIGKDFALIRSENIATGQFAMVASLASHDLGYEDFYQKLHSDNAVPGGSNNAFYKNVDADRLIADIRTEKSDKNRMKLYLDLQQVLYQDLPYLFLYVPTEKIVVSKTWEPLTTTKRPGYMPNCFLPIEN